MLEKFKFEATPVTENQSEILTILIEEAVEIQQRATKLMRFGPTERQPGQELDNVERLSLEIGDFFEILRHASNAGLLSEHHLVSGTINKKKQLEKYMKTFDQSNIDK